MKLLEGKTPNERNKIIAAALLGLVALFALYFAFGRSGGSSTATATVKNSPTPKPTAASPTADRPDAKLPTATEQDFTYQTTEVVYQPGSAYAPDPGRNIFAFYEPPAPCKGDKCPSPTPTPPLPPKPPSPTPTPIIIVASVSPQEVYAGARTFRLEVTGERFTPDSRIYFSQTEVPTTFVNEGKVVADIPAKLISAEGPRQIIVQTTDGKAYSNQMMLSVQAPPRPGLMYIGMIGRKRYNNDTAYFMENEKAAPFGARLNDVLAGRFRLVDISPAEVIFEDVNLGFRHHVPISKASNVGGSGGGPPGKGGGIQNDGGFPINPGSQPPSEIPGIPNTFQRNPAPAEMQKKLEQQQQPKKDVDDNDDGDG